MSIAAALEMSLQLCPLFLGTFFFFLATKRKSGEKDEEEGRQTEGAFGIKAGATDNVATVHKKGRDGGVCEESVAHETGTDEFEASQGPHIIDQRKVGCFFEFEPAFFEDCSWGIWFDGCDGPRGSVVKFKTRNTHER